MPGLRDIIAENAPLVLAVGGVTIGAAFGAVTYRTNFCTMGALSDIVALGDYRRFRSWLLAVAIALLGAQALQVASLVELARSMYLAPTLNWSGNIAGGLMFGFGMVFAGGCASRNLARAGGGDLRALMTLIILGICAYMTIGGLIGPLRAGLEQATAISLTDHAAAATQSVGDIAAPMLETNPAVANLMVTAALSTVLLAYCFLSAGFRSSRRHIASGVGVGLCVVAGWALTGLAADELAARPVVPLSLTFVRPTGDTLEWLQRFTALGLPGFGVATVLGTVLGAFVTAAVSGRFHVTTFADRGDTLRSFMGAALMGIGGVMALGCTIGQGITGLSTLALGSFLAFAAIVIGGICGIKVMERLVA